MSDRTEHWAYFQDLYRFAAVLAADAKVALRVVTESLDAALKRPRSHGDLDRLMVLLFQDVRARVLKSTPSRKARKALPGELPAEAATAVSGSSSEVLRSAIRGLTEPGRSALTLIYLDVLEAEEIQKVLGVTEAELAEWLRGARLELHAALANVEVKA